MTDTLKIGHAVGCRANPRFEVEEPGPLTCTCDLAKAQELAAEFADRQDAADDEVRKSKVRRDTEVVELRLDVNAWMETANQLGEELETLRRLAGDVGNKKLAWVLRLTNEQSGEAELDELAEAIDALVAHLESEKEKP